MSTVDEGEARNNKSNCKKAKEIARNCVNAIYDSMDPKPTGGVRRLLGADEFKAADWNGVNGVHSPTTMPGKQRKILSGSKYHVYGFVKTNEAWHTFDCGAF